MVVYGYPAFRTANGFIRLVNRIRGSFLHCSVDRDYEQDCEGDRPEIPEKAVMLPYHILKRGV